MPENVLLANYSGITLTNYWMTNLAILLKIMPA